MAAEIKIALAGNPNAGKTTLFNALTGARQHVGNYPGVTVEKKEGLYECQGRMVKIVDLPGTYSLTAYSVEEVVARDFLVGERPQVVINIVDAANLERNLYLSTQLFEMGIPTVIALNMMDVAGDRGISIDAKKLSGLLDVPVVPIVARTGQGLDELMRQTVDLALRDRPWQAADISYGADVDQTLLEMVEKIEAADFLTDIYTSRWTAIKLLEVDGQLREKGEAANRPLYEELGRMVERLSAHTFKTLETYPEAIIADYRYGYIKSILMQGVLSHKYDVNRLHTSDKIDRVLTHRFVGPLVMVAVLFALYQFTFGLSTLPMAWVGDFFALLTRGVNQIMAAGPLKSLIVSGIIAGVGGVLGFVPLIMLMFMGLAFLEDSGYLARVAFMLDRIFRVFGLHGNSVMAYIVSGGIAGGCAVPGVMATRTLRSRRERMATLLTAPFMNCGAKLPVMALLIGTFFAKYQAGFMLFLTILSWVVALLVAKFLRLTILKGDSTPFVMEMPPYRFPTFKGLLIHTWEKTWRYIQKAGTVILGISILMWVMMSYPGISKDDAQTIHQQRQEITEGFAPGDSTRQRLLAKLDSQQAELALRDSAAGHIGIFLEKISWLAGFNWRSNIALLGGVAAKEVIVSTLGTAYSMGDKNGVDSASLARTLVASPGWNPMVSISLLIFIMFYSPCFITVVCIAREAGSWRWGLFSIFFNTGFAFGLATLVYQLGLFLGFGG
ncbi:MAG: ferrous iron transport protein B [Deltaproteobacteria bacterium]|nr:ferrous iron transport protein B [Deltaproteobacteria bacterium]